jgi:hypothetical protein
MSFARSRGDDLMTYEEITKKVAEAQERIADAQRIVPKDDKDLAKFLADEYQSLDELMDFLENSRA